MSENLEIKNEVLRTALKREIRNVEELIKLSTAQTKRLGELAAENRALKAELARRNGRTA